MIKSIYYCHQYCITVLGMLHNYDKKSGDCKATKKFEVTHSVVLWYENFQMDDIQVWEL